MRSAEKWRRAASGDCRTRPLGLVLIARSHGSEPVQLDPVDRAARGGDGRQAGAARPDAEAGEAQHRRAGGGARLDREVGHGEGQPVLDPQGRAVRPTSGRPSRSRRPSRPTRSMASASEAPSRAAGAEASLKATWPRVDQSLASPSPVGGLDHDAASGLAGLADAERDARGGAPGLEVLGTSPGEQIRTGRPRTRSPSSAAPSRLASLASEPVPFDRDEQPGLGEVGGVDRVARLVEGVEEPGGQGDLVRVDDLVALCQHHLERHVVADPPHGGLRRPVAGAEARQGIGGPCGPGRPSSSRPRRPAGTCRGGSGWAGRS